jgi:hypothetical protein
MVMVRNGAGRSWLGLVDTDQSDIDQMIHGLAQIARPGHFDSVLTRPMDRARSIQLSTTARNAAAALVKIADQMLGKSPAMSRPAMSNAKVPKRRRA